MRKIIGILFIIMATFVVNSQRDSTTLLPNLTTNAEITISNPSIEGVAILFSTSVINIGSEDAGPFANHFYIDLYSDGYDPSSDVVLGELVSGLSVNGVVNFTKSWTAIEGTHQVRVLTDGTNSVAEFIENDNSSEWVSFTVLPGSPNLTPIDEPTIVGSLIHGTDIEFNTSIINNGSEDSGPFANHFYIDLYSDGYDPSSDIVLGELVSDLSVNSVVDFTKSWTAIEGTHQVRVLTDGTNSVSESVENDNSSEWISFTVSPTREFGVYGRGWRDYILNISTTINSIIYQFADSQYITTQDRVQEVFELLNSGDNVIINLALKDRNAQYFSTEAFIERVDSIVLNANITSLNQTLDFTLGEENSINSVVNPTIINGFSTIYNYLEFLHDTLSATYPSHNFKQWYSPRCTFIHQFEEDSIGYDSLRTPNINNDGWVFDHYNYGVSDYNKITDLYANDNIQNGTKTSSVIWASPDWIILTSDDISCDALNGSDPNTLYSQFTWWNEVGWRYFYNNIAKNIERNIPTYFFMYTRQTANGAVRPLYHSAANQCHHDFVNYIETITVPYMSSHNIPLEIPDTKPNWIPSFDFNACGCEENLLLSNLIYSSMYQVSHDITSNGYVDSNSTAFFKASTVYLESGFEVKLGADFSVEILPCQ